MKQSIERILREEPLVINPDRTSRFWSAMELQRDSRSQDIPADQALLLGPIEPGIFNKRKGR